MTDLSLWVPILDPKRSWNHGVLRLECRTYDPSMRSPILSMDPLLQWRLSLRMRVFPRKSFAPFRNASGALYYATEEDPEFCEKRQMEFPVPLDGRDHDYDLPLVFATSPGSKIVQLRFDPVDCPGACEISRFSLRV